MWSDGDRVRGGVTCGRIEGGFGELRAWRRWCMMRDVVMRREAAKAI